MSIDSRGPVAAGQGLPLPLQLLFAVATGLSVANLYYNQPLLSLMQRDLQASAQAVATVPTGTQLGYAAGLLLLGPLGDRHERRMVILRMGFLLVLALLAAALAPTITSLAVASFAIGVLSSLAQQIIPMVATLSTDAERGRTVGKVMSGLLLGVLGARTAAGWLGEALGWRSVFFVAAGLTACLILVLYRYLPKMGTTACIGYGALMRSVFRLFAEHRSLREASLTGGLLFCAFSIFWVSLSPLMESPSFGLGSAVTGLFGLIGVVGVVGAPVAGWLSDRSGPRSVVLAGSALVVLSFALYTSGGHSLVMLVLGTVALDLGAQAALIGNQSVIFRLDPAARGRINTSFMTTIFLGGAIGSYVSALAWSQAGWTGVCGAGAACGIAAAAIQGRAKLRDRR